MPATPGNVPLSGQVQNQEQDFFRDSSKIPLDELFLINYTSRALVYHLERMALEYSRVVSYFLSPPTELEDGRVIFGQQREPFFEFDAVISAGIRALDTVRGGLWRICNRSGDRPNSFRRTLNACSELRPEVKTQLESLWSSHCLQAKEYRDCIQHYLSPGAAKPFADMQRFEPDVWGMRAWLPDNPEARCARGFKSLT